MHTFIGRFWLDLSALILSAVVLAVGSYLCWFDSPVWLNRTGSLIIVIGVLVATCRFHDRLKIQLSEKAEANYDALLDKVKTKLEAELGAPLSQNQLKELHSMARQTFQEEISSLIETEKQRIKSLEIFLVVGGTLLNGFGDYAVCLLKACS